MKKIKISKWVFPQILLFFTIDMGGKLVFAFIFIIAHEFFHYLIAKKLGNNILDFKVHVLGATLQIEDYEGLDLNDEIIICLAGPVFNLIAGGVSFCLYKLYGEVFLLNIFEVNMVLGLLNLLPAYPLDGAKILRAILSKIFMYKKAHKIVMCISFSISVIFILSGAFLITIDFASINILIVGLFILHTTYTTKGRTMYIVLDQIIKKNKRFKKNTYIDNKDISVYYKGDFIKLLNMVEKNKFNTFHILNDNMELLYEIREDEVVDILKNKGNMSLEEYYNEQIK